MAGPLSIAVIGAGAWGAALASVAVANGHKVTLLARSPDIAQRLARDRAHPALTGAQLDPAISVSGDPRAVAAADTLVFAVPAQALRAVAQGLAGFAPGNIAGVIAAKGIEQATGALMHEVLAETLPGLRPAVLSGPSFAGDVAAGLPTAVTLATGADDRLTLPPVFARPTFRPYVGDDLIGTQIGGAVKNVLAIAAGIVTGRELGDSARAAVIARGLAEMTRYGLARGARRETFSGLSGLGDLVLTATSQRSRNMALGIALGAGRWRAGEVSTALAEGAHTAGILAKSAARLGAEMPISSAIALVLAGELTIDAAIARLLDRPLASE